MVLQAQLYPSAGPQQGYLHKEEYYKNDQYNSHGGIHDSYCSSNSSISTGPNPGFQSHGPNHHGGAFGGHHTPGNHFGYGHGIGQGHGHSHGYGHGHGHGGYPGSHGFGAQHGPHTPFGANQIQSSTYQQQYHGSSGPFGQHKHNSWISKDLED